ncbi:MAG: class I tRNA ligase family protein [Bdellovibrionaceae bacterium]|nr:class I tRNA ligase family protein [Pseudobdellovibrionaceae bacterium]
MNISSFNKVEFKSAYGILCHSVTNLGPSDALKPTFCVVKPGDHTTPHAHFEPEIFFIIRGQGIMTIGENSRLIQSGDLVKIPSFTTHQLTNTQNEPLEFLSVYTDSLDLPKIPPQVLITAAPPTPNGPLHLGHISGPYLAADIVARYLKLKNADVFTHSGTDDHQNYVSEKAHSLNRTTEEFRFGRRARIKRGLLNMDISFDEFIEPSTDDAYQNKIRVFFDRAVKSKVIEKETLSIPHCESCELTLVDVHADGICPNCQSPSRGGCESCGIVVAPYNLLNIQCGHCGKTASSKPTEVYTFNLSQHLPLILKDLQKLPLSGRIKQLVSLVESQSNLKVLVAYPTNEPIGIKVADQTLHVWFEMAAHYESHATQSRYWIHSFGFDNSFYYLLYIPTLLRAMNPSARLPDVVLTNEFLLLDGTKFSTSRGHAIWADEFEGNTEHLRLYLTHIRPSQHPTDFSMDAFNAFSKDLKMKLDKLFQQLNDLSDIGSEMPKEQTLFQIQKFTRDLDLLFGMGDLRSAAHLIVAYLDSAIHGHDDVVNFSAKANALAQGLSPFMPETSNRILRLLELETNLQPTLNSSLTANGAL